MYSGEIIPRVSLRGCSLRGKLANPSHPFERESGVRDDVRGVVTGAKVVANRVIRSLVLRAWGFRAVSSVLLCYAAFDN